MRLTDLTARLTRLTLMAVALVVLSVPALAKPVPAELPRPDTTTPSKDKPVKIYIMSGQSNMLGFGAVEGGSAHYPRILLSADPRIKVGRMPVGDAGILPMKVYKQKTGDATGATAHVYKGNHKLALKPGNRKPAKTTTVELGHADADLPSIDDAHTVEVKAFIEIPKTGTHEFSAGYKESSYAVATIDGREVYRKLPGEGAKRTAIELKASQRYPLTIHYFKGGQASMYMELVDLKPVGSLKELTQRGKYQTFVDDEGNWTVRTDVILNNAYMGKGSSKPLGPANVGGRFGPELGFGWVMGEYHDEPVIVMKADIGNRSLAWDILPPGSERYEVDGMIYAGYGDGQSKWPKEQGEPKKGGWYAGKQYDEYTEAIHRELKQLDEKYPQFAEQGFEVAGFVWWQGHKDQNPVHAQRYGQNLANLIKAWRKEFDAPDAKWVSATIAFGGWDLSGDGLTVAEQQLSVDGDSGRFPEFKGNVKTVEVRDFWRGIGESPKSQDYHYNHNAETYFLVGDALGRAMVELLGGKAEQRQLEERPEPMTQFPTDPTLQQAAAMLYTDDFISRWSRHPAKPTADDFERMAPALRPYIMGRLLPDYLDGITRVPAYRRGGGAIESLVYLERPERHRGEKLSNQLDIVMSYYRAAGIDDYQWKPMMPGMQLAKWNYISFDPPEEYPKGKSNRNREVTVPDGSEGWNEPGFDPTAAGWQVGQAPFGQNNGKQAPLRRGCDRPQCGCSITPNTYWPKEVLLLQQTFDVPELKIKEGHRYRVIVGGSQHKWAGEGFTLYIDGKQAAHAKDGYYKNGGPARGGYIYSDLAPEFEDGKITVALKAFLRYTRHRNKPAPPSGHVSVWLEEVKLPQAVIDAVEAQTRDE